MRHAVSRTMTSLLFPAISLAQANEPVTLPETEVKSRVASALEPQRTTSGFLIDEDSIRQSAAQNLSELLIEQGFAVEGSPTDYGENTTLIRGFQTEHLMTEANGKLLILIDGRRSGVANTRQINLNNVERIEVLRGPEMFKYALGSPGGVINVITKRGGPERLGGEARIGHGSYGAYEAGLDLNGQVNALDYLLGYQYNSVHQDYEDGNGDQVNNTQTDGTRRLNFNLGYAFGGRHRIGIDGYHYEVNKAYQPSYIDEEGVLRSNSFTDRETRLFHLNYEGASSDGLLSWKTSIGKGKDLYKTYNASSRYPKGQNVDSDRALASLSYSSRRFDLTGGVDYIKYEVDNSASARGRYLQDGGLDAQWQGLGYPMHPTSRTTLWGSYLVGTLKLWDGALNLSGGLRYEHASARDRSVGDEHFDQVAYFPAQGIGSREQLPTSRSFHHTSPTFGASWLPTDWLKLRANYSQGWRAPSGRQLFASSFYEDYGAPGDPRLDPERTDAFEIGFDMARPDWRLSASYFYYDIKDNIYIYPAIKPDGSSAKGRVMANVDKRIQEGFEIQASANVTGLLGYHAVDVRPYLVFSRMIRKEEVLDENGPGLLGQWWPITRMPDKTAGFGIHWRHHASEFSGNLGFNYFGRQYGGRANVSERLPQGFGGFTVANLSLAKRLWSSGAKKRLDLKIDINNLFDKTYSYQGRVPEDTYAYPGRNVYTTLAYGF